MHAWMCVRNGIYRLRCTYRTHVEGMITLRLCSQCSSGTTILAEEPWIASVYMPSIYTPSTCTFYRS